MTNNVSYTIAMNIYRALGGQQSGFESVEDVYAAVDDIYSAGGGRIVVEPLNTTIKGGGKYVFNDTEITGYKPVEINIDIKDGFNFGAIGYDEELSDICNAPMAEKLSYSKSLYDAWDKNNTSAYKLYNNDKKLYYPPLIDTSNVTDMGSMFAYSTITCVPLLDTSNVTNMNSMFYDCNSLTTIPPFNTSKVTDMNGMFMSSERIKSVPLLDTSNVTTMGSMFYDCSDLTEIPPFDTSKVTNMRSMFYYCHSLTTIPPLDTSNVTNMYNIFYGCSKLVSIPLLDCSKVGTIAYFIGSNTNLTTLGGFKNLGMVSTLSGTEGSFFISNCPNITYESIMNVVNNLYDRASAGYTKILTLKLHANVLGLLSDDDKAIATNKGWIIS